MYHVKPDKRSQTSARLISEGLIDCMKRKEFSQITITDIQRASGVGRSTFYRLFDNISDVLTYICDTQFTFSIDELKTIKEFSKEDFAKEMIRSLMKNEEVILSVTKSGRLDIMFNSARSNALTLRKLIMEQYDLNDEQLLTDSQLDYFVASFLCTVMSCLGVWISHGRVETVDEVYNNMIKPFERIIAKHSK